MQSFREKWENYIQLIQAYANSRGRTQRILIRTSLAIILAVATLYLHLYRIEAFFYDARMNLKGAEPVDSRIELVVLEHQDRKVMERLHLTPMRAHLTALKRLLREKPAAIAYFNRFSPQRFKANGTFRKSLSIWSAKLNLAALKFFLEQTWTSREKYFLLTL